MGIIYNTSRYINSQPCRNKIIRRQAVEESSRRAVLENISRKTALKPQKKTIHRSVQKVRKTLTKENIQFLKNIGLKVVGKK